MGGLPPAAVAARRELTGAHLLVVNRRDLAQCAVQPGLVEPVDPGQRPQLEVIDGADRTFVTHAFSLEQPDHGLSQGVVVALTDGPDRGQRAGVGEPAGVPDRGVLAARVGVKPTSA